MKLVPVVSLMLCAAGAVSAQDADRYTCAFTTECVETDRPCTKDNTLNAVLARTDTGWSLQGDTGEAIPFTRVSQDGDALFSLLSTQSDPVASAVTILSVAADGQAFVSTHGVFLSPGFVTHVGTCTPEAK